MPNPLDITNIPAPRVEFIDPRTGLMAREWYRFFFNLFNLTGGGANDTSLADLQVGPPSINQLLGDLGIVYDQAQLATMMAQYEQAARDIQNQLDTAPAQPQLGTLSAYNEDNVRLIGFDTSPSPAVPNPAPTGTLYWDGNSTLGLQMSQGVLAKIAQSQFTYVKASTTITKGQLVKHTGAVGGSGVITVAPTSVSMTDANQIVGVAAENIALNAFGFIQDSGSLRGFDTTGSSVGEVWADGDPLYYNPAYVGSFTKVKPSAPNLKSYIGEVINASSGGSGSISIRMSPGSVLGGTDSNVEFGTLANKDLIQYDSVAQYWKNVSPSTISIGTATNLAGGAAGSVPYQTSASTTTFLSIGSAGQYARVNAGATAPEWASPAALTKTDDTNVTLTLGGNAATALLNAASITVGWTGTLAASRLNANVVQAVTNDTNVTGSIATQTLTLSWSGQLAVSRGGTGVSTATANYVFAGPTSGVPAAPSFRALVAGDIPALSYVSSVGATAPITSTGGLTPTIGVTSAALTKVDDTNVTLTLGGSPTTALLAATSLTLGWTGTLAVSRGGTGTGTAFTIGSVIFAGASGTYSQNNAQFFWDNTNNRLGIGIATPGSTLDVTGTAAVSTSITSPIHIGGTGVTSTLTLRSTSGVGTTGADIVFQVGNNGATEAMRVLNSGNVGIGTASPANKLSIFVTDSSVYAPTTGFVNPIRVENQSNTTGSGAGISLFSRNASAVSGAHILASVSTSSDNNNDFVIQQRTGAATFAERLRLTSAGNVGIGTTSPGYSLDVLPPSGVSVAARLRGNSAGVGSNNVQLRFYGKTAAADLWAIGNDVATDNGARAFDFFDLVAAANRMRIDSAGNVGIGTITNLSTLTVNGSFSSKSPSTVNAATYSVATTDSSLRFTTTNCTVTLPAAASFPGRILYLNTITANSVISAASNVIPLGSNTAGTAILAATAGKFAMLQSDGTNWITMMAN